MNLSVTPPPERKARSWTWLVLVGATALAACGAVPHAGGWNDGSRLATVECLVDHHTWSIDQSVFVNPSRVASGAPAPYPRNNPGLLRNGTADKLFINGRFYSDKSPTPALGLAAVYASLKFLAGWTFRTRADALCYLLTLCSSGLAYVVAVWSIHRLGGVLGLKHPWRLLLTGSFALATTALAYSRQVNNHILLLGVTAALVVEVARAARERLGHGLKPCPNEVGSSPGRVSWLRLLRLGALAGLGYTIDAGAGPVLLAGTAVWLLWRCPRLPAVALFVAAAAPWVALHHTLNYAIGGVWQPANSVPAYFDWPHSPFHANSMTGTWHHHSWLSFLLYAADLLVGRQGFLGHNLALWLSIAAFVVLIRRRTKDRPELLLAAAWCVGVWLLYAAGSTNRSGQCCSIRWFVPLLAPGYYVLALWLRDCPPAARRDLCILSGFGAVMGVLMGWAGPWSDDRVPGYWAMQGAAMAGWVFSAYLRRREQAETQATAAPASRRAA